MIYNIYDSEGHLVRGGFHSFSAASVWKSTFGHSGYRVEAISRIFEQNPYRQFLPSHY